MKQLLGLLCLIALCLLAACGPKAEAAPGTPAPWEERRYEWDGLTLLLPEAVQDPRWSGPEKGVLRADFRWSGDDYILRVKKTVRLENLSDIIFTGPEGGELPVNAPRCVTGDDGGFFAWYSRGHSFTISTEGKADSDKLQVLYNLIHKDKFLSDFAQPPALWLLCGLSEVPAARTTYTWARRNNNGKGGRTLVNADGIHPLQMVDEEGRVSLTPLPVPAGAEAALDFELAPDALTVRCWPEETARALFEGGSFSDCEAQAVTLTVTEGRFTPPGPGNYIYEAVAEWSDGSGYGGTAYYGFYTTGS